MDCGIILSNGTGSRFGTKLPKQFIDVNGHNIVYYSINALLQSKRIQKIIIVIDKNYQNLLPKNEIIECIEGGDTRNASLKAALDYIHKTKKCNRIIVLEAARPMVTAEIVDEYISILDKGWDAVITGQKITDSLGCYDSNYVDRSRYYLIQAPEAFNFNLLYNNFDESSEITATNQQLPKDSKVFINFDFKDNYKITYPEDLKIIRYRMRLRDGL